MRTEAIIKIVQGLSSYCKAELVKLKEISEKLAWYQENYDKLSSKYFELQDDNENLKKTIHKLEDTTTELKYFGQVGHEEPLDNGIGAQCTTESLLSPSEIPKRPTKLVKQEQYSALSNLGQHAQSSDLLQEPFPITDPSQKLDMMKSITPVDNSLDHIFPDASSPVNKRDADEPSNELISSQNSSSKKTKYLHGDSQSSSKSNLFKCEICSKSFFAKSWLERHVRHTHTPFLCQICYKRFSVRSNFIRHQSVHEKHSTS